MAICDIIGMGRKRSLLRARREPFVVNNVMKEEDGYIFSNWYDFSFENLEELISDPVDLKVDEANLKEKSSAVSWYDWIRHLQGITLRRKATFRYSEEVPSEKLVSSNFCDTKPYRRTQPYWIKHLLSDSLRTPRELLTTIFCCLRWTRRNFNVKALVQGCLSGVLGALAWR